MVKNNLDKVLDYIHSQDGLLDDIYYMESKDFYGEDYIIFEHHDDIKKFTTVVKKVLDISNDDFFLDDVLNANIVFGDEYSTCDDCNIVIRTEPDSYAWQPDYYVGDGFIVCNRCFNDSKEYQEDYIENIINNPKNAVNGLLSEEKIEELGFSKMDKIFQDGWYGRNDNPEEIYKRLSNYYDDILFYIDNVNQFHMDFVVFTRGEK